MLGLDVRSLDRVLQGPGVVVKVTRQLTSGALGNARRSVEQISRSVDDRRRLQDALAAPQRPGDLGRLDRDECLALLSSRSVGRLAYVARAGVPDIVPVNYVVAGDQILIRTGSGPKLQAAERAETVAFEIDDVDEDTHSGWSVVVTGQLTVVPAHQVLAADSPVPWATGPRRHVMRLQLGRVTGRRLRGSSPDDGG